MVVAPIYVGGWPPKALSKGDFFNEQCPPIAKKSRMDFHKETYPTKAVHQAISKSPSKGFTCQGCIHRNPHDLFKARSLQAMST